MNKADSLVTVVWLPAAMLVYSLGEKWGMGRRWVGRRNKWCICIVQFEFLLMFGRPIHSCITLTIAYENNLLIKVLTKMRLFAHCFQGSESFLL